MLSESLGITVITLITPIALINLTLTLNLTLNQTLLEHPDLFLLILLIVVEPSLHPMVQYHMEINFPISSDFAYCG